MTTQDALIEYAPSLAPSELLGDGQGEMSTFHRSESITGEVTCLRKTVYITRDQAKRAKTRMRGVNRKDFMVYRCNVGSHFHLVSRVKRKGAA